MLELPYDDLPSKLHATAAFVGVGLCALAREEAHERKPRRLLEPGLATWSRFKGALTEADLADLLLEDAAVTQPFAFDGQRFVGGDDERTTRLGAARVRDWMLAIQGDDWAEDTDDYITAQAERLGLLTRMARSDLHTGIKPHHRVLELPGTGGQLAAYLVDAVEGIFLQDVFLIAWDTWRERMLAGLVAVEHKLTGTAPVAEAEGLDVIRASDASFDYVIGTDPERGVQLFEAEELQAWFPSAQVVLV